jgi:hypothetical protein
MTDNVRNEVVAVYKSLYTQTFLAPAEDVLMYPLKLFPRDICNFPTNSLFSFSSSVGRVTAINFVPQIIPEDKITMIKIWRTASVV